MERLEKAFQTSKTEKFDEKEWSSQAWNELKVKKG